MSKEKPILFSAPMVRALLDGTKTQTRRIVKPQPGKGICEMRQCGMEPWIWNDGCDTYWDCPYGSIGTKLWVRETFVIESNRGIEEERIYKPPFDDDRPIRRIDTPDETYWQQCHYRATDPEPELYYEDTTEDEPECKWRPSIFMPRWASRITLEIVSVRVERLQDISQKDVFAEGIKLPMDSETKAPLLRLTGKFPPSQYLTKETMADERAYCVAHYASLWESINGIGSWDANPWVWVITFKRI